MSRFLSVFALAIASTSAFAPAASFFQKTTAATARSCRSHLDMSVVDIDSEDAFDKTITSAAGALVVVDYSTTWCGPCKVIAPKFDELSDKYPDAVFLKVRTIHHSISFYIIRRNYRPPGFYRILYDAWETDETSNDALRRIFCREIDSIGCRV